MSNLGFTFDVNDVEPSEFELLPKGEFVAMIIESEIKPTKSGSMLVLKHQVVEGKNKGKTINERLNIVNDNEVAQRIARQSLAKICAAIGKERIKDSTELHNKRIVIKVDIEPGKGTYTDKDGNEKPSTDKNVIKEWHSIEALQGKTEDQTAPTVASPSSETKAMPWKR